MKSFLGIFAGLAVIAAAMTSHADTVQFDFGGGTTFAGTNAPAGITDTTWNDGSGTGILFGDGTTATGVTLELGNSGPNAGADIDWTAGIGGSRGAQTAGAGVYATDLTTSWLFETNGDNLGVRVSGLAPGEYDVFTITRESTALDRTYDVGIGVGNTANFTGLAVTSIGDATGSSTFIDGQNFSTERVTVTSLTDFITVIVDPTNGSGEQRFATISGLQIVSVPIPEPTSAALLLGLGMFGFAVRRR